MFSLGSISKYSVVIIQNLNITKGYLRLVEDTVAQLPPAAVAQGGLGLGGGAVDGTGENPANHRFYSEFGKKTGGTLKQTHYFNT